MSGFVISASARTNKNISPVGITTVTSNANQTYIVTPNCGYPIADVTVDGVSQGAVTSYTFTNVTASHTISATFAAIVPTITASGATTFFQCESVTLTSSSATGNIWSNGATTQSITVSEPGDYTVYVSNGNCQSSPSAITELVVLDLPDAEVTQDAGVVTATQGGASYQWYTCDNQELEGETGQTFVPTVVGDYYVIISNSNCSAQSACISVTQLDTRDHNGQKFVIYPNPVTDVLHVSHTVLLTQVKVFNIVGQEVLSNNLNAVSTEIDMSHLPAGMFLVKATAANVAQTFKVIKK